MYHACILRVVYVLEMSPHKCTIIPLTCSLSPAAVQPSRGPDRLQVPADGLDTSEDAVPLHLELRVPAAPATTQAPWTYTEDRGLIRFMSGRPPHYPIPMRYIQP